MGENHTGKSSLVKSLFTTLGAKPKGKLEIWDPKTISAVDIRVNGIFFRVIHQDGARALFDESGSLLFAGKDHASWSEVFARLVGFNLVVTSKNGVAIQADPACFFIPFYIDQDGSWRDKWETFPAMLRFSKPISNILEYFSGIKPPEYYELKAQQNSVSKEKDVQVNELRFLERTRSRMNQTFSKGSVVLSEVGFEQEIVRLADEATQLNSTQEELRAKYVRESEIVSSIEQQINVTFASLNAYSSDQKYLANNEDTQELVCPTCGAHHEQSFLHFLGYAEDARILEELALTLQSDAKHAKQELSRIRTELTSLRENYSRITALLEKKRGDLKFSEIVESHGAHAAQRAFDIERENIEIELANWNAKLLVIGARLDELTDKKRAKKITEEFRGAYKDARTALNVPDPYGRINLMSRPNRSGSGGPRLLLAYYAAIWKICLSRQHGLFVPVVIDSPNQQDQDNVNLHVVLEFIAESLPASMQLIVCVTKPSHAELDKTIVFDKKYSMLLAESYDEVESIIGPFYRQMNHSLLGSPVDEIESE